MDERRWLACTDPSLMLEFLRGKVSDRKLRLFLCATTHQIRPLLTDQRSWQAVEVAEQYADGLAHAQDLDAAHGIACEAARHQTGLHNMDESQIAAASAAWWAALPAQAEIDDDWTITRDTLLIEKPLRCYLLRDIFSNPFRPVTLNPTWRTLAVLALAQAVYDHRTLPADTLEPDRLAVLADALEESGCTDADILNHLRGPGPHVRGCWVVDLILSKDR